MDILVMVDERGGSSGGEGVVAHVNSVPARADSERPARDVITLYGDPDQEGVALALAAAVESRRQDGGERSGATRNLGVSRELGAVGDSAWRDASGELVSHDVHIPFEQLRATAEELMRECGSMIGRLLAGLRMPDWPEGARRAISVTLDAALVTPGLAAASLDQVLDAVREADGDWWDATPEVC